MINEFQNTLYQGLINYAKYAACGGQSLESFIETQKSSVLRMIELDAENGVRLLGLLKKYFLDLSTRNINCVNKRRNFL